MHENEIGTIVVDSAVRLHQDLGPGLLETVYEVTLARKLEKRGLFVQRQFPIPIIYDGQEFEEGFRGCVGVAQIRAIAAIDVDGLSTDVRRRRRGSRLVSSGGIR